MIQIYNICCYCASILLFICNICCY